MTRTLSAGDWPTTLAWPLALAAGAIGGSLATACMMPFVAIAVLCALTMGRAQAAITVVGCWAANQLIGFGLLGFPMDVHAVAWGAALGAATLASMLAARNVFAQVEVSAAIVAFVFLAVFSGYEALLFGFSIFAGGFENFSPAIVLRLLANETAWLLVLGCFHRALSRMAPRLFTREPARRIA